MSYVSSRVPHRVVELSPEASNLAAVIEYFLKVFFFFAVARCVQFNLPHMKAAQVGFMMGFITKTLGIIFSL